LASYSGNATYGSSTSAATSIVISKNDQTVSFTDIPNKTFGGSTFSLVASASSGNAVTYTSTTTSKCTVNSSGVVTIVAAGTCSISVSQAGNSTYNAALTITKSFTIAAKALTITGTTIAAKVYNGTTTPAAVTVGSITGLNGSDTMTATAAVANYALATAGTYTPVVTYTLVAGSVGLISNYFVDTQTVTAVISQASQTLTSTFSTATLRVGDTGVNLTTYVTASSGLAPSFVSLTTSVCSIIGSALTLVATGTCNITASQAGSVNYLAALDLSDSMTVLAAVVITPPTPPSSGGGGGGGGDPAPTPTPVAPTPAVAIQKIRNLAVTVVETNATLTWTAISTSSIVIVKASDGTTINLTAPANASTIEVSNLEPGFAYSATVTPNSAVDSSSADTVTFALAPSAPKDLQVQQGSGNLVMKWTGAKGSAQYRVAIVIPGRPIETIVTTNTEIVISATPGLTYTFMVVALGDAQLVSPVSEVVAKVPATVTPPVNVEKETVKTPVVAKTTTLTLKIYFARNSYTLDAKSKSLLNAFARKVLKAGGSYTTKAVGYTQPASFEPKPKTLSLNRAKVVAAYLKKAGIKGKYTVSGAGQGTKNLAISRNVSLTVGAKK
jgi:outer membrane protein OmpA-like peptidoglycan-associated protein